MTPVFTLTLFSLTIPQTLAPYTATTSHLSSSTATTVATSLASPQSSNAAEIGGIVGGVLGGVIVILGILVFYFWSARKRRQNTSREGFQVKGTESRQPTTIPAEEVSSGKLGHLQVGSTDFQGYSESSGRLRYD